MHCMYLVQSPAGSAGRASGQNTTILTKWDGILTMKWGKCVIEMHLSLVPKKPTVLYELNFVSNMQHNNRKLGKI